MNGYNQKTYACKTKRYVQTLDLRDDPDMIKEYRKWHSETFHWKEIRDGIKAVGILEMEIYILGTRLVMIVDAPRTSTGRRLWTVSLRYRVRQSGRLLWHGSKAVVLTHGAMRSGR